MGRKYFHEPWDFLRFRGSLGDEGYSLFPTTLAVRTSLCSASVAITTDH